MTWYVAYTGVRQERRAVASLTERGIEAYAPCEKHLRSHARIKDTVERVIFPRYIFVNMGERDSFYAVKQADGVESLVGFCGTPQPIPFEWVHEIRESERAGFFDYTRGAEAITFEANDPVKIIGGPFAGQLATIIEAKPGAKRVQVLLKVLGRLRPRKLGIAVGDVEKAA